MSMENCDNEIVLATGGYDHTIKLWQADTGLCRRTMPHTESQVNALEITRDKQLLAAANYRHIYMYDLISENPNPIVNCTGTPKNVTSVGFEDSGKWMYSGGEDGTARIWDIRSMTNPCTKILEVQAPINCACLHPNQTELFVGDQNGIIYRWDLRTDIYEALIPEEDASILDIAISPDSQLMASVNNKGRCYIWSLMYNNESSTVMIPKHKFEAHNRYALKCKFSPDSDLLITTSADQTAKIWKTSDFSLLQVLKQENQKWVWDAAFTADGQYVFTASSDGFAKLWNVKLGTMEQEYAGHEKAVTALAFRDAP